jgi:hypothetical protein
MQEQPIFCVLLGGAVDNFGVLLGGTFDSLSVLSEGTVDIITVASEEQSILSMPCWKEHSIFLLLP